VGWGSPKKRCDVLAQWQPAHLKRRVVTIGWQQGCMEQCRGLALCTSFEPTPIPHTAFWGRMILLECLGSFAHAVEPQARLLRAGGIAQTEQVFCVDLLLLLPHLLLGAAVGFISNMLLLLEELTAARQNALYHLPCMSMLGINKRVQVPWLPQACQDLLLQYGD